MPDLAAESPDDARPAILVCRYDGDPADPVLQGLDAPGRARAIAVPGEAAPTLAETLLRRLDDEDCRGLLLVGPSRRGAGAQVQTRTENREADGRGRVFRTGPGVARATAPAAEMVRALAAAGVNAAASSETEADAGSYLLYRVLAETPVERDAPSVGLLRLPADMSGEAHARAVRAAAGAMASNLFCRPRSRTG